METFQLSGAFIFNDFTNVWKKNQQINLHNQMAATFLVLHGIHCTCNCIWYTLYYVLDTRICILLYKHSYNVFLNWIKRITKRKRNFTMQYLIIEYKFCRFFFFFSAFALASTFVLFFLFLSLVWDSFYADKIWLDNLFKSFVLFIFILIAK